MGHTNAEDMRQSKDMFKMKKILKKHKSEGSSCIAGLEWGELPFAKQH